MDLLDIYQKTTWPEVPGIINYNNDEIERAFNLIYDASQGIIVPVTTTGRVKGSWGEFVHVITDNLTVKNQYTNLYENSTTADYNWYTMLVDPVAVLRDPCTALTYWPFENYTGYKIIDVNKPYYKITNAYPVILNNANVSQVVGVYFDSSLIGTNPFQILLDPCLGITYTVDVSYAGSAYIEFIAASVDPSWGTTWQQYKYAIEGAGGTQSSLSIIGFLKESSIGSDFIWQSGLLSVDTAVTGVRPEYVDGSLAKLRAEYIPEVSLGNNFYWSGGYLEINSVFIGASKLYVDGSLLARDDKDASLEARIETLEVSINYVLDISTILVNFISNSSLSADFYWNNGQLEVSSGFGGPTFEYIDGSLAFVKAKYIPDSSLSADFYWNNGQLEVSSGFGGPTFEYVDGSLSTKANDASLLLYVLKSGDTMTGNLNITAADIITHTDNTNVKLGKDSFILNTYGTSNTIVGNGAMAGNTIGSYNTAVGRWSLVSNSSGNYNTAIGFSSMAENTTGEENIAIGYNAGTYTIDVTTGNTEGKRCIFIGVRSMSLSTSDENEIVIGTDTKGMGSNTVVIGNEDCVSTYLRGALYVVKDVTSGGLSPRNDETNIVYYNENNGEFKYGQPIEPSVLISSAAEMYMGNPNVDGCWRFVIDLSGNLSIEKRIGGNWMVRATVI